MTCGNHGVRVVCICRERWARAWVVLVMAAAVAWLAVGRWESQAARALVMEERAAGEFAYALRIWRESQRAHPDFASVPR